MRFLKSALSLSHGKISCLIFNFYIPITDQHLMHASERYVAVFIYQTVLKSGYIGVKFFGALTH